MQDSDCPMTLCKAALLVGKNWFLQYTSDRRESQEPLNLLTNFVPSLCARLTPATCAGACLFVERWWCQHGYQRRSAFNPLSWGLNLLDSFLWQFAILLLSFLTSYCRELHFGRTRRSDIPVHKRSSAPNAHVQASQQVELQIERPGQMLKAQKQEDSKRMEQGREVRVSLAGRADTRSQGHQAWWKCWNWGRACLVSLVSFRVWWARHPARSMSNRKRVPKLNSPCWLSTRLSGKEGPSVFVCIALLWFQKLWLLGSLSLLPPALSRHGWTYTLWSYKNQRRPLIKHETT